MSGTRFKVERAYGSEFKIAVRQMRGDRIVSSHVLRPIPDDTDLKRLENFLNSKRCDCAKAKRR